MSLGLIGTKQGMTRLFTPEGDSYAVSVVSVDPNTVTQIKTDEVDGYNSVQVTTGVKKEKHVTKPLSGHYKKGSINPGEGLWEFKVNSEEIENIEIGSQLNIDIFEEGQKIDVQGKSKGKGFAGTVKRWNFKMQDATHGNSISHRTPGSTGQCQFPGRVFKGKKMAGQMGDEMVTRKNLQVVKIDVEKKLMLVKGSVPGFKGRLVEVTHSAKRKKGDK